VDQRDDLVVSPLAEILPDVELGTDVAVGPFSVIGYNPASSRSRFHGRELVFSDSGTRIGNRVTIGAHCVIERGAIIGDDCFIDHGSFVGAGTIIESGVFVRYRAQIYRRVRIGERSVVGGFICNDVIMGSGCDFFGICVHRYVGAERGAREPAPQLGRQVFVGFNAVIAGPVALPDETVVTAGAVVTASRAPVEPAVVIEAAATKVLPTSFERAAAGPEAAAPGRRSSNPLKRLFGSHG
jgi:UDP-3-O-[3-hydroxymyristoyl] glucosamine N-acyltransferase